MKARKRPIEVTAIRYNHSIDLIEFLKLLSSNKNEPVRYDDVTRTIYIKKEHGEIALTYGNWVIYERNTDQCFWAIDHDIFLKTYKRVPHTVNTFVKNIYEVDCFEFKSLDRDDIIGVLNFLGYTINNNPLSIIQRDELIEAIQREGFITLSTLEGEERFYPTEIVIRGIKGEVYLVKRENFDKVYEILD